MKFLKNWTIDLDKIPAYVEFNQDFTEIIDLPLAQMILDCDDKRLTEGIKTDFKKLVQRVDTSTNLLPVKYSPRYGIGRRYPDCPDLKYPNGNHNPDYNKYYSALIASPRLIKNTIFKYHNWIDIDQVKGHPTILYEMGLKNGITLPAYERYLRVGEFDNIVRELIEYYSVEGEDDCIDKKDVKWLFNKTIYGGGHAKWVEDIQKGTFKDHQGKTICKREPKELKNAGIPHPFYKEFHKDTQKIIDLVYLNNDAICNKVCEGMTAEWGKKNRVMSYFCGAIENEISFRGYKYLVDKHIIKKGFCDWGYDGFTFPFEQSLEDLEVHINDMNAYVRKHTGFNTVSFIIKPFDDCEVLSELVENRKNIVVADKVEDIMIIEPVEELDNSFDSVSAKFEENHAKIINQHVIIKILDDGVILMTDSNIRMSYSHLVYNEIVETKGGDYTKKVGFIGKWSKDNETQRTYEDMNIMPYSGIIDNVSPKQTYNLWKPFNGETITSSPFKWEQEGLDFILNHILILCDHQKVVADYIIKWIAQMIQYPTVKTICPTLISKEGAGKGTLIKLMEKMLGKKKVMETTDPSGYVWGKFNGCMAESFFVVLNEMSKKDTLDSVGKIKGLITDTKLHINNKGINAFEVVSNHRFMITTNSEEPITTKKDDRRNLIIRSSDEKIGDTTYFDKMYELLDNNHLIKTCYEYFKSIPDMDKFGGLKLPITTYQEELKELSRSPIELWFEDFATRHQHYKNNDNLPILKITAQKMFNDFQDYITENKVVYAVNNVQFGVRFSRLKFDGSLKDRGRLGVEWIFDLKKVNKLFDLGCLLI